MRRAGGEGPFQSLEDCCARVDLPREGLENLVMVGAFDGFGTPRRELLWRFREIQRQPEGGLALTYPEEQLRFPELTDWDRTAQDYQILGLTAGPHLTTHFREEWTAAGGAPSQDLRAQPDGMRVRVAGLVITRQAPETAKGHVFITLEDEFGTVNTILRPGVFLRYKPVATQSSLLILEGRVVHDGGAVNVLVETVRAGREEGSEALRHDFD